MTLLACKIADLTLLGSIAMIIHQENYRLGSDGVLRADIYLELGSNNDRDWCKFARGMALVDDSAIRENTMTSA